MKTCALFGVVQSFSARVPDFESLSRPQLSKTTRIIVIFKKLAKIRVVFDSWGRKNLKKIANTVARLQ